MLQYPHPQLRAPNARVGVFGAELQRLANDMFDVMYRHVCTAALANDVLNEMYRQICAAALANDMLDVMYRHVCTAACQPTHCRQCSCSVCAHGRGSGSCQPLTWSSP